MGFLDGTSGKEPAYQCRRQKRHGFNFWVRNIHGEGNGNPLQYSCLENSTEEPGMLQSMEKQRVKHDWAHVYTHMANWNIKLKTTYVKRDTGPSPTVFYWKNLMNDLAYLKTR